MESDLISRSALIKILDECVDTVEKQENKSLIFAFGEFIKSAPAIDAVPVVRCRDCERRCTYKCPMYHTETCFDGLDGFDDYSVDKTDGNGFCHQGKRNGR